MAYIISIRDSSGVLHTVEDGATVATKEFFVPATNGTVPGTAGQHTGYKINDDFHVARIELFVPADFSSIIEAVVTRIALSTGTHGLSYFTNYAASGEVKNLHIETSAGGHVDETDEIIYEYDLSSQLSALAANDYVGIQVESEPRDMPNDLILGVRFRYS